MSDCIFCKIIAGQIPSKKVYEDERIYAFHDINPAAKVHFLMVPKKHVASLETCGAEDKEDLSHLLLKASELAKSQGLDNGFRTIINTGPGGGQEVYHLHIHVLGGSPMKPLASSGGD
jgi:histidine triad (HIT) family protein